MKSMWTILFVFVLFATQHSDQASCKYGGRGSLTSICVDATSAYFKTTTYRFDHLDETVRCVNCTLTVIESGNFDFYYNQIKVLDLTNSDISLLKAKAFIGLLYLEKLLLSSNKITTIAPLTFAGINKLQHLDVRENKITTLIADGFKELKDLKTLLFGHNYIKVVEKGAFNGLVALLTLDLSNNLISVVREVFDGLPSLASLNLENNEIQEIQPNDFATAGSVVQLNLVRNQIRSIAADTFLSFERLETLNVSSNPVGTIVVGSFRGLGALEDLDLSNGSISDVPKGSLLALHNLRSLDLSRNKVQGFRTGAYSGLPELRKLNLSRNEIAGYAKTGVFSLGRLHTLDLSHNKLQDIDYKLLVAHMPTISYLELSNNPWRCHIAKEMEEEFEHDNIRFNFGEKSDKCSDVGSNYTGAKESEGYEPEVGLLVAESTGHQYVLYVFMVLSLGAMAYMFYAQFKSQKEIKYIIGTTNMAEARLIQSSEMDGCHDYA